MKVSKEKRAEIRRSLVNAAIALYSEKGISEVSMREIAARAGVAPGTAYKYFPNREHLFHAYFELKQEDAEAKAQGIPDFEGFDLKEKLQAFLEALLAEYVEDREFVALALRTIVDSPLQAVGAIQPTRRRIMTMVEGFFEAAIEAGELPRAAYQGFLVAVFWEYVSVVVLYWLKDDSEGFARTSEFIDRTLDLYVDLTRSQLVDKAARVAGFLLKSHLYGNLDHLAGLFSGFGKGEGRAKAEAT